jgi:hypothetical protein
VSVFGPHYEGGLQDAINHAERFCQALALLRVEGASAEIREERRAWLEGRSEEIEAMLEFLLERWKEWRVDSASVELAEGTVRRYLSDLHVGVREVFGLEAVLDCCFSDAVSTVFVRTTQDATRLVALPELPVHDTELMDPQAISDWLRLHRGQK